METSLLHQKWKEHCFNSRFQTILRSSILQRCPARDPHSILIQQTENVQAGRQQGSRIQKIF